MRTSTLLALQSALVIGWLAAGGWAGNACCKASCHEIPKGCYCPFKAVLCGELNTLTMGKRRADPGRYESGPPPARLQAYPPSRTLNPQADRLPQQDRFVGVLNNLLTLLEDTQEANKDAFDGQENDNNDWAEMTSNRVNQPAEHAHEVYRRQPRFLDDVY